MRLKGLFWFSFILMLVVSVTLPSVVKSSRLARIYIDPVTTSASPGNTFTVDIKVADVIDLFTYGFYIKWVGPVLNVTTITEGDFLNGGGVRPTFFTKQFFNGPDPTGYSDWAVVGCTLVGAPRGIDGSGTLARVTFLVEAGGTSFLDLYWSEMRNKLGALIPHQMEDGYFNTAATELSVEPKNIIDPTLVKNEVFSVNVTIQNAVGLKGFEFKLGYNNTLLNATELNIVPFLNEPVQVNKNVINQTRGFLWVNVTSTGTPVTGSGTVANVTFQVKDLGEGIFDLYDVRFVDEFSESGMRDHTPPAVDGFFTNIVIGHELAVKSVKVYPTRVTVGASVSINVSVVNGGIYDEVCDVSTYYDGNLIGKTTGISLKAGNQTTVKFIWDTKDVAPGTYTIKGVVGEVPGEADKTNNVRNALSNVTVEAVVGPNTFWYFVATGAGVGVVVLVGLVYFLKFRKPKAS